MFEVLYQINEFVWNSILAVILLGVGIYFSYRSKFLQVRYFFQMFSAMRMSFKAASGEISPFKAYCTSLAARIGTGNLAGVAVAIHLGGPGAVFWMWVVALLGMVLSFIESTLAQIFKQRSEDGNYIGGPAYYIYKGLGKKWLGVTFSVLLILAFGFTFNSVQTLSISSALHHSFDVPSWLSGALVAMLASVVILGGVQRIVIFAEFVVPIMGVAYIGVVCYVVALNLTVVDDVLLSIVSSAFGLGQAGSGLVGYGITRAMINGVKRGLYSSEAGMGSAPNVAAIAYTDHPASQGLVQMFGVFTDTIIVCTCTALVILIANDFGNPHVEIEGITLTQRSFTSLVGDWGADFIAIILVFFAFTSIVANYYYGEASVRFIADRKRAIQIYRIMFLVCIVAGSVGESPVIWTLADLSMAGMTVINLFAIISLGHFALALARDYFSQAKKRRSPVFRAEDFPELNKLIQSSNVWKHF